MRNDAMSHVTPTAGQTPARNLWSRVLLLLLIALPIGAGAAFVIFSANRSVDTNYSVLLADYARRFGQRAKLDEERYQDRDGDLVADVPQDPARWLKPAKLRFTGITLDEPTKAELLWKPLLQHLEKETGCEVQFDSTLTGVEAQIAAVRDGQLHVTAFPTGSVPAAVNAAGFVPVCVPANADGLYAYQMEIIVPANSSVRTGADLAGRQVTFSAMSSNAGLKAPIHLLREKFGLEPGTDYTFNISGGYSQSIKGIAAGRFQAASIANDVLQREVARGTIKKDQFRTIFKSSDFPPMCFGHPNNLDPELAAKVRQALLSFPWEGTSVAAEYGPIGLSKFVPVSYKKDWELVRAVDAGMLQLGKRSS